MSEDSIRNCREIVTNGGESGVNGPAAPGLASVNLRTYLPTSLMGQPFLAPAVVTVPGLAISSCFPGEARTEILILKTCFFTLGNKFNFLFFF